MIESEFIVINLNSIRDINNWTREIFVVSDINQTNPITYKLEDLNGDDIIGSFYTQELQLTKFLNYI